MKTAGDFDIYGGQVGAPIKAWTRGVQVEARLDADVIDESPGAYKPISAVMAAQTGLVDVVAHLRQVVNVKG